MLGLRKITKQKQGQLRTIRLLHTEHMERILARERERCDRYFQYFSMIVVKVAESDLDSFSKRLDNYLEGRLRVSDDAGFLKKGGIGIVLPMTTLEGAQNVLTDLHDFAKARKVSIETEIFTYSGHDGVGPDMGDAPEIRTEDVAGESTASDSQRVQLSDSTPSETHPGIVTENEELPESDHNSQFSSMRFDSSRFGSQSFANRRVDMSHAGTQFETGASTSSTLLMLPDDAPEGTLEFARRTYPVPARRVRGHRESALLEHCATPFPIWKRGVDVMGAAFGLIAASPIILVSAIAIKLTSRGPILFKQMRCGQYGRPFAIYKLRTMVVDAEELKSALQERNERDGPAFKLKDDPRVTKVGSFLRRVGADELPQLFNVLVGDMSIVGPRPLPIAEDMQCASWQRKRLDTKPGLTCTWQVGKSRKISFLDWMRLDRQYGKERSLRTDVGLVFKTIAAVVLGRVGH